MTELIDRILAVDVDSPQPEEAPGPRTNNGNGRARDDALKQKKLIYAERLRAFDAHEARTPMGDRLLALVSRKIASELAGPPKEGSVEVFHGPDGSGKRFVARQIAELPELQPTDTEGILTKPALVLDVGVIEDCPQLLLELERALDPVAAFKPISRDDLQERVFHLIRLRRLRWLIIPNARNLFDIEAKTRSRLLAQVLVSLVETPSSALRLVLCCDTETAAWINRSPLRAHADYHEFEALSLHETAALAASYRSELKDLDLAILDHKPLLKDLHKAARGRAGAIIKRIRKALEELPPIERQLTVGEFGKSCRGFKRGDEAELFVPRGAKPLSIRQSANTHEALGHNPAPEAASTRQVDG